MRTSLVPLRAIVGSSDAIDRDFQGADREFRVLGLELSNDLRFHEFEFASDDFIGGEDKELIALDFSYLGLFSELRADDFGPSVSELVCGL